MTTVFGLFALAIVLGIVVLGFRQYFRFRGARVVTCPETHAPVGVELDAKLATSTALTGTPEFRLTSCTRWPERKDCGQECLRQIEVAPEGCLVRNILAQWFEGKSCVYCMRSFAQIGWSDHKPSLLDAEGRLVAWADVPPQELPKVLETHRPVCWDCAVIEGLAAKHPELVVDRSQFRTHDPGGSSAVVAGGGSAGRP